MAILIVVSQNQSKSSGGDAGNLADVGLVESQLQGIPQHVVEPSAKVTLIDFGDLQCPVCKAYSEEVIPQVISGPVRDGEAKIELRNYTIISEQSVPAGGGSRRGRRAETSLELHRALLPQPGRGGLGLRHRRLHDLDRQGGRGPGLAKVERGSQEQARAR